MTFSSDTASDATKAAGPPSAGTPRIAAPSVRSQTRLVGAMAAGSLALGLLAASPYNLSGKLADAGFHLRAPDFDLLAAQSPVVLVHLGAAVVALLVGLVIMAGPKGAGLHKLLGWGWVAFMAVTAISSLFIRGLNGGAVSFVHLLSGWTIISLPLAILLIRRRDVNGHRRAMTGLFVGGLIIAGALTFLPGRLMWRVFFG